MPRKARLKSPESVYHIICRSVSEFLLFRDNEDKDYYLSLLKRYTDKYKCSIYAYCLMDNHVHIHFDAKGFDVSKFMHSTNTAYVRYYNKKYNRHGHLFQDRFESRVLGTDEYNLSVSAYIHNNPSDIEGYRNNEHLYKYSSYGIYLGKRDLLNLIDKSFIKSIFNNNDDQVFVKKYCEFVSHQRDMGSINSIMKQLPPTIEHEYRSERKIILRDRNVSQVLSYISDKLIKGSTTGVFLKAKRKTMDFRAFCAYTMRTLCGLSYREICQSMYNMTASGCARLCDLGFRLTSSNEKYTELFNELMNLKIVI